VQQRQGVGGRAQDRQPGGEQTRMTEAVGVDERWPWQLGQPCAQGERQHSGGVGGLAGRERLVDDDHGALWTVKGVSPSTSSERVRALCADGVITGYHAAVDLRALGRDVQAMTAVTIRPPTRENIESFRNWVAELPELVGVFVVSGASDFLLHVAVPDTNALYAFVIDRLTERNEVAHVNPSVVYEHVRRPVLEPLSPPDRLA
jgi:DNA-binding Lrp family transcriptional regulator